MSSSTMTKTETPIGFTQTLWMSLHSTQTGKKVNDDPKISNSIGFIHDFFNERISSSVLSQKYNVLAPIISATRVIAKRDDFNKILIDVLDACYSVYMNKQVTFADCWNTSTTDSTFLNYRYSFRRMLRLMLKNTSHFGEFLMYRGSYGINTENINAFCDQVDRCQSMSELSRFLTARYQQVDDVKEETNVIQLPVSSHEQAQREQSEHISIVRPQSNNHIRIKQPYEFFGFLNSILDTLKTNQITVSECRFDAEFVEFTAMVDNESCMIQVPFVSRL